MASIAEEVSCSEVGVFGSTVLTRGVVYTNADKRRFVDIFSAISKISFRSCI